jgi:uncharacterized protein YbjQ (UPF0145 family)
MVKKILFVILIIIMSLGCSHANYKMLTDTKLKAKPKNFDVELFVGKIERPYKPIAIVQSKSYDNKFEDTKIKQMEELKEIARKLGADAVHNIRMLDNSVSGYVIDYQVPFLSWKQGKYQLYFLRGEAVVYENNEK